MWKFLVKAILRNRIGILVVTGLITLFMGYMATRVRLQYETTSILPASDSTTKAYKSFIKQFGEDGTVMFLGMIDSNLFRLKDYRDFYDLSDSLKHVRGVEGILSIASLYKLVKNDSLKKFEFVPVWPGKPSTRGEVDSIRKIIFGMPF